MAKKKTRTGARTAATSKVQKLVAPCLDCGEEVEVQRLLIVGSPTYKTWQCKAKQHRSIDASKRRQA
jgi:hypothetical protein